MRSTTRSPPAAAASARRSASPASPIWTSSATPTSGPSPTWRASSCTRPSASPARWSKHDRGPFSLATETPERRLELRVGKLGLPDTFDLNSVGTDSHLQFLNWTVDNNGAWDYAADTRGYTYGAIAEYDDHAFSARYGLA
jgi:high affinity Mn2+ porin